MARGLAETRAKAQALLLAGRVFSGERRLDKAGMQVDRDVALTVRGADHPWVSRGGVKLDHALTHFGVDPQGLVALDVGASTGGFTHVLCERGARQIYAVDVGYGQLDARLRNDPRVIVLERTNARYLTRAEVPEPVDLIVCDASFIGLRTVLPAPLALAASGARLIALIKPQFEAGRARVGKGGIVRDPAVHRRGVHDNSQLAHGRALAGDGPRRKPHQGPRRQHRVSDRRATRTVTVVNREG